ncbi:MAG: patatin-like phospholipase family protein, partial [Candidatus Cloacimonetes bacterium]|nr:patatin-like phospholipase family protein [Candidatus Cloacimonadota bacterium]
MRKYLVLACLLVSTLMLSARPRIGLALSGGGARGFAHIGVLKVIEEKQIPVDYIAGTSTGAIIGGLFAIGYSAAEIEDIFLTYDWRSILDDRIPRENLHIGEKRWKPYSELNFALDDNFLPQLPQAIFAGNRLINALFEFCYPAACIRDFAELKVPFCCTATNLSSGELKVFDSGYLHEAIRASMSIPSLFEPFPLSDSFYLDGGINANLPAGIVRDMGADIVIGSNTATSLKADNDLQSLLEVLDQTMNFQLSANVEASLELCDLVISPELGEITNRDFDRIDEIILLGETAARQVLKDFSQTVSSEVKSLYEQTPAFLSFSRIKVTGNRYLSSAKVIEYLQLKPGINYSREAVSRAFAKAYSSDLFKFIYPRIDKTGDQYELCAVVSEKERKHLGIGFTYNEDNEFVAGLTVELDNYFQKYSKLLFNIKLGTSSEINLDYVKNFGKHWGVYFRLFPYFGEQKLYSYNDQHEKIKSVKAREIGGTFGVGLYTQDAVNAEIYAYSYEAKTYRDVADFENTRFISSGLGFKVYHESLDDYMFPMKGSQVLAKICGARKNQFSDAGYKKFYSQLQILLPFGRNISCRYQFEYGSYFQKYDIEFDPFYIGGMDSFLGLQSKERSAPIYKVNTIALRFRLNRILFLDLQYNVLSLGEADVWLPEDNLFHAGGMILGIKAPVFPMRIAVSL